MAASRDYYAMPPNLPGDRQVLVELANSFKGIHLKKGMLAISSACMELSMRDQDDFKASIRWYSEAAQAWNAIKNHPQSSIARQLEAARYLDFMQYWSARPHSTDITMPDYLKKATASRGQSIWQAWQGAEQQGARADILGLLQEQTFIEVLGNTGLVGLSVAPSLERQKRNSDEATVDRLPYRWNLTVESDGTEITEGQYRVQVRSSSADFDRPHIYHPEIAVITVGDHWAGDALPGEVPVFEALQRVLSDNASDTDRRAIDHVTEQTLRILEDTGPTRTPY